MPKVDMAALEREAAESASTPKPRDTATLRALGEEVLQTQADVADLEAKLAARKERLNELVHKELPDLMKEIRQDHIGMPDWGERGTDLVLEPYYKAGIGAEWPADRREAGFAHLEALGAADLIRNVVSFSFTKGQAVLVDCFLAVVNSPEFQADFAKVVHLSDPKINDTELPMPQLTQQVPWQTLTAFVREWFENPREEVPVPIDLEKLGATVGTVVKIKPRKGK